MSLGIRNARYLSLISGLVISLLFYFLNPFHVSDKAALVLAIATLMITWWVTEALPLPVVALLPLVLFPLTGISSIESTSAPYADPIIFLFMGGFMLGLALEKWDLHRRIALNIVMFTGNSGNRIILGFILATGFISLWISNTATTMMMFPIALSVIHVMKERGGEQSQINNFALSLMLVIAYAANFGGIGTKIGTPPNIAYVMHLEAQYKYDFSFFDWMLICMPIAILLMFALYLVLVKFLYPNKIKSSPATRDYISSELSALGPMSSAEKKVLTVFFVTALLWILREPINKAQDWIKLDDTIIAMMCGISLFIIPAGRIKDKENSTSLLEWSDMKKMAWGILLLFGGGLTLAKALNNAGLIQQLGEWIAQFSGNPLVLLICVTVLSIFISEVMSNIAQVVVFAPVVSSVADSIGMDPLLLGLPMTLAASCASMLPMGTPPNAIVFASGHIRLKQMIKTGLIMNIVSIILITLFSWFLLPLLVSLR